MFSKSLYVSIVLLLIVCSSNIFAIPAGEGKRWETEEGRQWRNGDVTRVDIHAGGDIITVACSDSENCCWEITNNGKDLEIYTGINVPPIGDLFGPSETEIYKEDDTAGPGDE